LSWAMGASWEMELLMRWYELGAGVGIWQLGAGRWNLPAPLRGISPPSHRWGLFSDEKQLEPARRADLSVSRIVCKGVAPARRLGRIDGSIRCVPPPIAVRIAHHHAPESESNPSRGPNSSPSPSPSPGPSASPGPSPSRSRRSPLILSKSESKPPLRGHTPLRSTARRSCSKRTGRWGSTR
jgi:hypothetical protein